MRPEDLDLLSTLRNKHKGQTAFVFGTGRSLGDLTPDTLNYLSTQLTIGCNYLLRWEGLQFTPTYRELHGGNHNRSGHRPSEMRVILPILPPLHHATAL